MLNLDIHYLSDKFDISDKNSPDELNGSLLQMIYGLFVKFEK